MGETVRLQGDEIIVVWHKACPNHPGSRRNTLLLIFTGARYSWLWSDWDRLKLSSGMVHFPVMG